MRAPPVLRKAHGEVLRDGRQVRRVAQLNVFAHGSRQLADAPPPDAPLVLARN
jgi:hypothetical protein